MLRKVSYALIALALASSVVSCSQRRALLTAAPDVPGARGVVEVREDSNGNVQFELKVEHLAKPGNLTPAASTYVVWLQTPEGPAQNQGQLQVGDNLEGRFVSTTPNRNFTLFVTAENSPTVETPAGMEVLRTRVQT
jgi:hypothetical protein